MTSGWVDHHDVVSDGGFGFKDQTEPVNTIERIRHQCRKATVLSYDRCLISTGVEKNKLKWLSLAGLSSLVQCFVGKVRSLPK